MFGSLPDFGKIAEMLPKIDAFLAGVEQRAKALEDMQAKIMQRQDDILTALESIKEKK